MSATKLKCTRCGKLKSLERFHRDRGKVRRQGRMSWCKLCVTAQTADYRAWLAEIATCQHCGKKTGRPKARLCDACRTPHKQGLTGDFYRDRFGRPRYWTKERIVKAIKAWERQYGKPPTATNWGTGRIGRGEIGERRRKWPSVGSVQFAFGSWNAAIQAAGFKPLRPGGERR